uniref:DDRGK domain-containing protein 1 n=1 Tax=Steinernema glaseri TaxID=37863 RepID=A0A1I7ZW27_9BILA
MSPEALGVDGNVGKKKLAKLQAKAEKRAQREYELAEREERKKREAEQERREEERRRAEDEAEKAAELKAKLEREERERREHEEYLKMKEQFEIGEEGFDQLEEEESENLMRDFVNYVQKTKVVYMDELAKQFKLRTEDALNRLNFFVENGTLSGVFDDRGKFIYITEEEMHAVAKFITQRGRVSVTQLADYSNKLINLEPAA